MESTDSSSGSQQQPNLPPGFRFHPTDEELVVHYLKKKATSAPLPVSIIADVDLYKFDPWELPAKSTFGEQEWYFFSPRDRKYPNGARPNRAAISGYWKATGTDKPVLTAGGTQKIGVKKALVFYGGKPPKGIKTNWIMHEYRLVDNKASNKPPGYDLGNKKNSLRLDDWVLCRIYKKNNTHRPMDHDRDDSVDEMLGSIPPPSLSKFGLHQSSCTNYSTLLENDPNLFGEMMLRNDCINTGSMNHHLASSSSMAPSMKRAFPSLYWGAEEDAANSSKRFNENCGDGSRIQRTGEGNGSIANLFSHQLPQTPSFQQQTLLGSVGDAIFSGSELVLPFQV